MIAATRAMLTVNELLPGQAGRVVAVRGQCVQTQRLLAMGLLPGALVKLIRMAPLRDPITLRLSGCEVSVRRCDAARIAVESVEAL